MRFSLSLLAVERSSVLTHIPSLSLQTYCLFFMAFGAQLPNGLISSFSTVIIKGLGVSKTFPCISPYLRLRPSSDSSSILLIVTQFGTLETTLLGIPPNVIQVIALLVAGWVCSRFKNMRVIVMTVGNLACLIAAACMCYLPTEQKWQRLVCFWITPSQSVGFSLMLVMVSSNGTPCPLPHRPPQSHLLTTYVSLSQSEDTPRRPYLLRCRFWVTALGSSLSLHLRQRAH